MDNATYIETVSNIFNAWNKAVTLEADGREFAALDCWVTICEDLAEVQDTAADFDTADQAKKRDIIENISLLRAVASDRGRAVRDNI
jgi:hypothetical protein